jgi:hypothetical protein
MTIAAIIESWLNLEKTTKIYDYLTGIVFWNPVI